MERNKVKHQGMKTPGRRGEQIKHEEIDKEIARELKDAAKTGHESSKTGKPAGVK